MIGRDLREARRRFERAAERGGAEEICALADFLSRRGARAAERARAEELYQRAFRAGHALARL